MTVLCVNVYMHFRFIFQFLINSEMEIISSAVNELMFHTWLTSTVFLILRVCLEERVIFYWKIGSLRTKSNIYDIFLHF